MSHRSDEFVEIAQRAEADLRELLGVSDDYAVLFLQGGATAQFAAVPLNLLGEQDRGRLRQHRRVGEKGHQRGEALLPRERGRELRSDATSTAFRRARSGSSIRTPPTCTSSATRRSAAWSTTTFPTSVRFRSSRTCRARCCRGRIDVSRFGAIYAGAQKNIGPAGLVLVIVRRDLLGRARADTPSMLDWKLNADNDSMYNTPATYSWYIAGLVFRWIKRQGGLAAMEQRNRAKAQKLYRAIDASNFYRCPVVERGSLADERHVHAGGRVARQRLRQGRRGGGPADLERAIAASAACARASTTPCRKRRSMR